MEYFNLTDEKLVALNKSGDGLAFDELYARYIVLIRSLARTYFLVDGDEEDLCQEGLIGLFSAVNAYDGEKEGSSSFKTFAFKCIKSKILNAISSSHSKKQKALNDSVSIQDVVENEREGTVVSPEDRAIDEETLNELISAIKQNLSNFEIQVFNLYVEGQKYTEIAKILNKSPKSVDNAIQRIKEKTKKVR